MDPEVLAFVTSEVGAAAMESPQDDEAGKKAIELMAMVNKVSSEDMIELAAEYGQPLRSQTIIELGPGAGYATKHLLATKNPACVLAYEVSSAFRKVLNEDEAIMTAVASGILTIRGDDSRSMPDVPNSSVDVIFGMNVVYFLRPLDSYLTEMLRVLKPGGWIIFGTKMNGAKVGCATSFVNTDVEAIIAQMTAAGFSNAAAAAMRLATDPPTPGMYVPVVCQKPPAVTS